MATSGFMFVGLAKQRRVCPGEESVLLVRQRASPPNLSKAKLADSPRLYSQSAGTPPSVGSPRLIAAPFQDHRLL